MYRTRYIISYPLLTVKDVNVILCLSNVISPKSLLSGLDEIPTWLA